MKEPFWQLWGDISLLVYKNAVDFWILTLHPVILPNSLIRLSRFFVETIGFPMYTIMSSPNNDSFTSSFPIRMPFLSFSWLVAVARTSSAMLNKSSESRHPCLVLDLRGKAFSFCLLSMVLAVGFSYMTFIVLRYASYIHTLLMFFIINGCWILSNAFSASIDMII